MHEACHQVGNLSVTRHGTVGCKMQRLGLQPKLPLVTLERSSAAGLLDRTIQNLELTLFRGSVLIYLNA